MNQQLIQQHQLKLVELQKLLGIQFKDQALLTQALTHKSFANENRQFKLQDNERLEFFGDAVLKLVVSELIMKKYPQHKEGELTKIRAAVVSDAYLAQVSAKINLGSFLLLSPNESKTGGAKRKSNLANAFEALLGAIYLDQGIVQAGNFVEGLFSEAVDHTRAKNGYRDCKSELQEWVQQEGLNLPEYKVLKEEGPDHQKVFVVQVKIGRGLLKQKGEGKGSTKKEAEQLAASHLLAKLKKE